MTTALAGWFSMAGRVTVVTGASSGLGASFAETFAEAGSDVVLGARRADRLSKTAEAVRAHGRRALTVETDVSVPEQCDRLVARAMDEFGRVDVLINNAGIAHAIPATRETPEQFRSVIEVNLNGSYWMAQACGRVMLPGSSIINISSVLAVTTAGLPQAAYSSSKAALSGLTRDLAQQWGRRKGIRVNALAPGFFDSEMTETYSDEYVANTLMPRLLVDRVGHPMELAATAVWLAAPASGFTTGQTIVVDGGMSVT
ncbi:MULTISPECIES: SDR family NAD(P)-dependent oxidoreductase [unclassified Nocardioides]|uniref:SDR family NAD(P)-dependent oxidoreductase n=1 Tax=unclassified Nocardioides TaxID=2615069 RepID=UPI0006FD1A4D|nr:MULTISPECIES: SDR family oxidoreductase [unclassified Nocardioides]KRA29830.1 short-chain dehydrogenase [Nocardioides sp. Root614]KRA86753.1 short-chain dehydrogenase [Nocardioides sp. Root682]